MAGLRLQTRLFVRCPEPASSGPIVSVSRRRAPYLRTSGQSNSRPALTGAMPSMPKVSG
jgi:hypothetical protein